MTDKSCDNVDWGLCTWEGAKRETLRRWASLPLERIIAALEEMDGLNEALHGSASIASSPSVIQERRGDYCGAGEDPQASERTIKSWVSRDS